MTTHVNVLNQRSIKLALASWLTSRWLAILLVDSSVLRRSTRFYGYPHLAVQKKKRLSTYKMCGSLVKINHCCSVSDMRGI